MQAAEGRRARARRPGIAISRRGKRNAHRPSTTQTELSQPSPSGRADVASSSGNCSARSARTSASSIATSAIPLGHRGEPIRLPLASAKLRACTGSSPRSRLILLGFAAISGRVEGTWITAPMVFTAAGLVVGVEALGLVDPSATGIEVKTLAEATLAVVLFSDASRIDLKALRRTLGIPARLLGIGLPLTILAGFVVGARAPRRSRVARGARSSRSSSRRPTPRSARPSSRRRAFPSASARASTSRAGLNDGICVPLFFIALAVALAEDGAIGNGAAAELVLEKIGYGVSGAWSRERRRQPSSSTRAGAGFVDATWLQVVPLAGALLGVRPGRGDRRLGLHRGVRRRDDVRRAAAASRRQTSRTSWSRPARCSQPSPSSCSVRSSSARRIRDLTWQIALYAILSLTVVRMVPVAIAMLGTSARRPTVAFLGWFGPRGAASIVFALLLLEEESALPNQDVILTTVFVTVGLSVLAHGATAAPLADAVRGLARRARRPGATRRPSRTSSADVRWRLEREPRHVRLVSRGRGTPDRRPRAAPRRLGDDRPRHGARARLPPDRPDLDRRAAAAARPLEPTRAVRRRRARPPALGRAEALRVERVHLADRVAAARPGAHAATPAQSALRARALERRVPRAERALQALRAARARAQRADAVARARSTTPFRDRTSRTAGGGAARSR